MHTQTAKLVARIAENLPNITDDVMQAWIEDPKGLQRFLAGLCPPKEVENILAPYRQLTVGPLTDSFNPHVVFQTREGLWVSPQFTDRILSVVRDVAKRESATSLQSFTLVKDALDTQIRAGLPENHLVEPWQIAALITKQPKGEEGDLLTNGYANLFYVKGKAEQVFVVHVHWFAGNREWYVNAWKLVENDRWYSGHRLFSCN